MTHRSGELLINLSDCRVSCAQNFTPFVRHDFSSGSLLTSSSKLLDVSFVPFDVYEVPCSFYYLFIFVTDLVAQVASCMPKDPLSSRRRSPQEFESRRERRDVTTRKGMLLLRFIVERKIRYLKLSLSLCLCSFPFYVLPLPLLFHVSPSGPTIVDHLRFNYLLIICKSNRIMYDVLYV